MKWAYHSYIELSVDGIKISDNSMQGVIVSVEDCYN